MPGETTIQNIVDPQRVVRTDQRADQQDAGDLANAARYDSGFMTFLQRLRASPDLGAAFLQVLQWKGVQVSSGVRAGLAADMSQFLEFLQMDEGKLRSFLQNQVQSGSRFSGALFNALRAAYQGSTSELAKNEILQFVRRYSNFTSTDHLEAKILRTTEEMGKSLPSRWANPLSEIHAQLANGVAAGDRQGNLKLLREQVIPLIAKYVSTTHDHGRARGLLSMLTLDIARYENGAKEPMLQSFRALCSAGMLPKGLGELKDEDLVQLLKNTEYGKASKSDAFADRLSSITSRALAGEGGVSAQEAFRDILTSLLLNESVYMPLAHFVLPLNWDGDMMFSELWVDPDADEEGRKKDGGGPTTRILIKMDIQSLGAFDVLISARDSAVNLSIRCPERVAPYAGQVSDAMEKILTRNGLKAEGVSVAAMQRPVTLTEVFPKIFERMDSINVKA